MVPIQPLFSGVAEETLWRLLLLPLCYLLLRPAFPKHPAVPLIAAIVFSSVAFGLGHGYNLDRLLTTGLMYGLAMATVFTRRGYEHAVGAHYMVNFVPWGMVFLAN
jgi:membrane protease YdiL (CAAX protease family)